jgi:tetratricopeptide (TPR) repeat protein
MKDPENRAAGLFLTIVPIVLSIGLSACTTTPEAGSPGLVAAPVPETTAEETAVEEEAEEKPATEELAKKKEVKRDPIVLAAAADAKVKWSSSQATLREAFSSTGEAAALAPGNSSIALQHARHGLRLAQTESGLDRPAAIAKAALKSMDSAGLAGDSLEPVAAYYRASLTGLVLQSQGLGAAGKLPELEKLFKKSTGSPATEKGGPWRALGMLYLKAPAWPTGIGDIGLALENLEKAASSHGDYPHNHICLARALADDGSGEEAETSLKRAEELLASGNWGGLESVWRGEIAEIRAGTTNSS